MDLTYLDLNGFNMISRLNGEWKTQDVDFGILRSEIRVVEYYPRRIGGSIQTNVYLSGRPYAAWIGTMHNGGHLSSTLSNLHIQVLEQLTAQFEDVDEGYITQ